MSRYDRSSRRASASRNRRNRLANSSVPGYDNLGWDHFGHPASSDQPSVDEYGFDSEFGEGVRKGPYRSGPAPASVGWDPEHPASSDLTKEDYAMTHDLRQENLKQAMERKAQKCIMIAESRLGKRASRKQVEDLALRMMDLPNRTINARVARLADDAVIEGVGMASYHMADDEVIEGMGMADDMYAEDEIIDDIGLMADQNDPEHFADDAVIEGMNMASNHMSHTMRDVYDTDGDGMISRDEWGGSDSVFDAMDMDDDGFLDADELGMGVGESIAGMTLAEELAEELATLKMANARLARKVRKLAEDADAKEEDAEDAEDAEAKEEKADKEASRRLAKIERLANALSAYMAEADESSEAVADEDMSDMASLLAELETEASDEMGEDVMGLDAPSMASIDPRLASIFTASEEEGEEEGEEEASEEPAEEKASSKKAGDEEIQMGEEEGDEDEGDEEPAEEKASSKKASYKPRRSTRQASVKTLGNISREASSSDELSKLWESAPDVSKFFN